MCLVLYLGSERKRPEKTWDPSAPKFHVNGDDDGARNVRMQLKKAHIYYVGSDHGCGCGFRQEHDAFSDDDDQQASKRDNHRRLHDYISNCLRNEKCVELYSCWSGDEQLARREDRKIQVVELLEEQFWFAERQRTIVVRND